MTSFYCYTFRFPAAPSTPESTGRSRDIEINIASPQATNSPQFPLPPLPSQHQLCHYLEPVMILSEHQIQTLLTAYHLQINSGVQRAKFTSGDVLDRARLKIITSYSRLLTSSRNPDRLFFYLTGNKPIHVG